MNTENEIDMAFKNPELIKEITCPNCHGTGIDEEKKEAGYTDPYCKVCDGYGVIDEDDLTLDLL